MKHRTLAAALSTLTVLLSFCTSYGAERERKSGGFFESIFNRKRTSERSDVFAGLSSAQLTNGVKQALEKGLLAAVNNLGRTNGFLTNAAVRIPMPQQIRTVESALRKLKQDALVDQFELSMNRAAEKAVPAGAEVLVDSLKQVSVDDAVGLLTSKSPTAITDYFRRTSTNKLGSRFLPIVKEATAQAGVTSSYKQLLSKASFGNFSLLN